MSQDRYALELERSIYNWYMGGKSAPVEPIANALHALRANDGRLLAAVETPECFKEAQGEAPIEVTSDAGFKYRRLIVNDAGDYFLPVFTGDTELNKGEPSSYGNSAPYCTP